MTRSVDVVVIGAGCGGLSAAVAAAELGLDCLLLEKAARIGGGTSVSSGYLWVGNNHLHEAAGGTDSAEAATDYLRYVGAGGIDEARMAAFVTEAPRALRIFEGLGIPFRISPRIDHYGMAPGALAGGRILDTPPIEAAELGENHDRILLPSGPLYRLGGLTGGVNSPDLWKAARKTEHERPGQRGAGAGLVSWLVKLATEHGVTIATSTPAARLIADEGRITGVVTAEGETIEAQRGVVIASGGYESNPELVHRYEALPGWQSMFPESLDGDGLVMATELGAAVHVVGNNLSVFLGFRNPDEAPGGTAICRLSGTQELPSPHTIVVNRYGRRFADESFFQAVAPALRSFDILAREQANLPCYLVFDQSYVGRHSFGGRPPGADIPDWVARADTPEALAAQLGVSPEGLRQTVDRFNADVRDGVDREFGRGQSAWGLNRYGPSATLGTIEAPPFYGIRLHPTALSSAGLLADPLARVRHVRGHAIPGLYAVGNAAARNETGSGYQTGFSLTSGMTFGWIAARHMAAG